MSTTHFVGDGSGIGGSAYLTSIDWRQVFEWGNVVWVTVTCTTTAIPAWTQFMTIAQAYLSDGARQLRTLAFDLNAAKTYVLDIVPSTGVIRPAVAIPAGANISFQFCYVKK